MSKFTESDQYDARLEDIRSPDEEIEQTPEQEDLASALRLKFDEAYEARLPYEREWELNRQYIKGDQTIIRNASTGETLRLNTGSGREMKSNMNVLRPTVRSFLGKLTRSIPTAVVLPANADFHEQEGARAATSLLEWARRDQELDRSYIKAHSHLPYAGNGFIKSSWNPDKGRKIALCPVCDFFEAEEALIGEPCPRCSQQREMEVQTQQMEHQTAQMQEMAQVIKMMPPGVEPDPRMVQGVPPPPLKQGGPLPVEEEPPPLEEAYEGSIDVQVCDTRDIYVDPACDSLDNAGWYCHRQAMHIADVQSIWPHIAGAIKAETDIQSDKTARLNYGSVEPSGDSTYMQNHVYVYEFHERPTFKHRKGRTIYMVNDALVQEMDDPYWELFGRFNIYQFGLDDNPGEFWKEPWIKHAWHRQRELNQVETQIREHLHLLLRPKVLNPMNSNVSEEEFTTTTGQVIKYNPAGGPLKMLEWPSLPSQVFMRKQELVQDIRLLAGVTEQDAGIMQSDPNGRAAAIVEAESDQQMGPIMVENHGEWRDLHRGLILLMLEYAHPDTTWSIVGPEGIQTYSLREITLSPGWDIQLEQSDGLSRNPALRFQQGMDMFNAGIYTDPATGAPDTKAFMRHAKINLPRAGFDIEATEKAAAAQIPELLKNQIQHVPQPENDPTIYAETLLGWLRGPGRKEENIELVSMVRQIWMFYVGWAMGTPPEFGGEPSQPDTGPGGPGGAGAGGPDMSAPGGSANNPGHMASGQAPGVEGRIQQADQMGENQAQVQGRREG